MHFKLYTVFCFKLVLHMLIYMYVAHCEFLLCLIMTLVRVKALALHTLNIDLLITMYVFGQKSE